MNNRRDRLSADMKGTVAIGTGKQSIDKLNTKDNMDRKEQNDGPESDAHSSMKETNTHIESREGTLDNDAGEDDSHRQVVAGDQERLQLDWRVSQWSRCSQTCGPNGRQVKTLKPHLKRNIGKR